MLRKKEKFGRTGLMVPPIIFGTSCLGNLYAELPYATKLSIVKECFKHVASPVVLDTAGKYGAGLALESVGKCLRELGISPKDVIISNKLGWQQIPLKTKEPTFEPGVWVGLKNDAKQNISYDGIYECYEQGLRLLGPEYTTQLVSVHDPDEYLNVATTDSDRKKRMHNIISAYQALKELKHAGKVVAVGIGAKDWHVIREIFQKIELDWVMFACSLTIMCHPNELLDFIQELHVSQVALINSAVFHGGFLTGGEYFDYRKTDPEKDAELFRWRSSFYALCNRFEVAPAAACVQFAIKVPGIASIALNTGKPERIGQNVMLVSANIPKGFWQALRNELRVIE